MRFVDLVLDESEPPAAESREDARKSSDLNPHVARLAVIDRMHGQAVVLNRRENEFIPIEAVIHGDFVTSQ